MARSDGRPRYFSALLERCEQHGEFTSMLLASGWSTCVACAKSSEMAAANAGNEAWRRELSAREWEARLGRAAIPERFADRRLDTYRPTCPEGQQALQVAQRYADNFGAVRKAGACLIFCGDIGTGKTHLSVGIAHAVLEQGGQAVFTSVRAAVGAVKETWERGAAKTEPQVLRELISPDLLILDEVGVQFGSDTEKLIMFDIINGRYESRRPTIIISNLALGELEKYLGARAVDRLREGGGKVVVFDWESYRGRREALA
ncbi:MULTISPECIES: ATP-binding protein [unclassified Duganella]|uniref:ATP-binding protein n=1 Tax=unclassified Duganella TaxID=2636909 RepID=UPI00087EB7E4|nr:MULTISPECIES: ATP-binding protein [unclassified Duganella]SDF80818.1 DNA replication protein DnaC [Duganella sp. OV458]SDI48529.1 DNA replication protein DnaC [Duganella sp. OV510]